jgi:hypothetical protein
MMYLKNIAMQVSQAGGFAKWSAPYGDWVPADPNTKVGNNVCAAYNYAANVQQMITMAQALEKPSDVAFLKSLYQQIQMAYGAFYNDTTRCWGTCGQSGYAMAYQVGVIPSADLPAFAQTLADDITARYNNHVSVGIIGAKALFPTLTALNLSSLATALAEQTSYPSWGYMLASLFHMFLLSFKVVRNSHTRALNRTGKNANCASSYRLLA